MCPSMKSRRFGVVRGFQPTNRAPKRSVPTVVKSSNYRTRHDKTRSATVVGQNAFSSPESHVFIPEPRYAVYFLLFFESWEVSIDHFGFLYLCPTHFLMQYHGRFNIGLCFTCRYSSDHLQKMLVILIKGFCVFVAITELSYALFRKKYIFLVAYNLKKEFYSKQKKMFSFCLFCFS